MSISGAPEGITVTNPQTYTTVLTPEAQIQRSVLSAREKGFHIWQRWRQLLSHCEAGASSTVHTTIFSGGPVWTGAAITTSRHAPAVLTLTQHRLGYNSGARAACLQTMGNFLDGGVQRAYICCLWRKPSQPLAKEAAHLSPGKSYNQSWVRRFGFFASY